MKTERDADAAASAETRESASTDAAPGEHEDADPPFATVAASHAPSCALRKPPLDSRVLSNVVMSYEGETLRVPQCDAPVYHGHGRAVFRTGFTYTGEFALGRMHGHGRVNWASGIVYDGSFVDNEIVGQGTYTWPNGSSYVGEVRRGRRHGVGTFTTGNLGGVALADAELCAVDSECLDSTAPGSQGDNCNGNAHGSRAPSSALAPLQFAFHDAAGFEDDGGETNTGASTCLLTATSNARYEGQWVNGLPHGMGVLVFDDAHHVRYEGAFARGRRHGRGEMRYASGNVYRGDWVDDAKCGHGMMLWVAENDNDGEADATSDVVVEKYVGAWAQDQQHGRGRHVWLGGARQREKNWYEGEFNQGQRHGSGTFYYANGARYEGEWQDNVKSGRGAFFYEDGRVFVGEFRNDRAVVVAAAAAGGGESEGESGAAAATTAVTTTTTVAAAVGKIQLYVDDLLPKDALKRETARRLVENAALRLNTDLRALYRQYLPKGDVPTVHPTRGHPLSSPAKTAKTADHSGGMDSAGTLMEYYECRRLLADCGIGVSAGQLESLLEQIRSAQRATVPAEIACRLDAAWRHENAMELTFALPEVIAPERLVLFREFVELLVRLASWRRLLADAGESETGGSPQSVRASLAEVFADFCEQIARERMERKVVATLAMGSAVGCIANSSMDTALHCKELQLVFRKHHSTCQSLFKSCLPKATVAHEDDAPDEGELLDGIDDSRVGKGCAVVRARVADRVTLRSLLALLRDLGVFVSSFRVRDALAALQGAFTTVPAKPNAAGGSSEAEESPTNSVVVIDAFLVDLELVFAEFLDAIAVVVLAKDQLTAAVDHQGAQAPLFAAVDAFLHTVTLPLSAS